MQLVVKYAGMLAAASDLQQCAEKVQQVRRSVGGVLWEIRYQGYGCENKLGEIREELAQSGKSLRALSKAAIESADAYQKTESEQAQIPGPSFGQELWDDLGWGTLVGGAPLGSMLIGAGKVVKDHGGIVAGWGLLCKTSGILKKIQNYKKISPMVSTGTATGWCAKWMLGLNKTSVSQAGTFAQRFKNNFLYNKNAFFKNGVQETAEKLTGAKGGRACAVSWADIALRGAVNFIGNKEEQKEARRKGKKMSDDRVAAETITETVLETTAIQVGSWAVGAAVASATTVAMPVVVTGAIASLALTAINTGVKHFTGKSATEWTSDFILDTGEYLGKKAVTVGKSAAKQVGKFAKKAKKVFNKWCKKLF